MAMKVKDASGLFTSYAISKVMQMKDLVFRLCQISTYHKHECQIKAVIAFGPVAAPRCSYSLTDLVKAFHGI